MHVKDELGRFGEDLAARHLTRAGLEILERNWRCPTGEIDILALEGDVLVVCEVKTRSGVWMTERGPGVAEVRFDVVGVLRDGHSGQVQVQHLRGVI
jgi:putative endonuclease